jgi:hypothetical protein
MTFFVIIFSFLFLITMLLILKEIQAIRDDLMILRDRYEKNNK